MVRGTEKIAWLVVWAGVGDSGSHQTVLWEGVWVTNAGSC